MLEKTNVCRMHAAQTYCRSVTTLNLMGHMTDIPVIVGNSYFHFCSCQMSLVHFDGVCIAVED